MQKKHLIPLIILILLYFGGTYYRDHKILKMIEDPTQVTNLFINGEEITSEKVSADIIATIGKYDAKYKRYGYHLDGSVRTYIEIHYLEGHKSNYIVLGDINFWYQNSNRMYTIINGDDLWTEIHEIMRLQR